MSKLTNTLAAIDLLHQGDPKKVTDNGEEIANELLYAQQMTAWLNKLTDNPGEFIKIAVRSQHLCRWELPRDKFEMNRAGYLKWRIEQGKYHAQKASQVMSDNGYDRDSCQVVYEMVRKKNLKSNPDTQLMEDAACLVFLEFQFKDFAQRVSNDEKIIHIVQKTWAKMSPSAHDFALKLSYSDSELALIQQALA
jgi:Domain of unknown function (DUF4202)